MAYAFHFDASACSGCKACQVACRDRNALPEGVRWRRVYEMVGGGWARAGDAWVNDVVAYHVSMACNHCESPACVAVCPTGALHARTDGVVLLDTARCMGCRYCEWACPYGAPQYDAGSGCMTKCTLCSDDVAAGRPPACVAACPLRALDFGTTEEVDARHAGKPAMHPLPDPDLTRPRLRMTPHARAPHALAGDAATPRETADDAATPRVANAEEVLPAAAAPPLREPALVAFTLMLQAAAGITWALLALTVAGLQDGGRLLPLLAAAALALAGGVAATLHLGSPLRAWRALARIRDSWLSREVAAALLFTGALALAIAAESAAAGTATLQSPGTAAPGAGSLATATLSLTAAAGLALVLAMAAVYRLPAVPAWDTALGTASFLLTGLYLGALCTLLLLEIDALRGAAVSMEPRMLLGSLAVSAFGGALLLVPRWRAHWRRTAALTDPFLFGDAGHRTHVSQPGVLRTAGGGLLFLLAAVLVSGRPGAGIAHDYGPALLIIAAAALVLAVAAATAARLAFYGSFARRGL